jgi:hypothetical protein
VSRDLPICFAGEQYYLAFAGLCLRPPTHQ